MKINFVVDENYLVVHTLSTHRVSSEKFQKDIVAFKNMAWERSKHSYGLLTGNFFPGTIPEKELVNIPKFIKDIKNTAEYRKIYKQTLDYRNWVEKKWVANFKKTLAIMEDITGLQFEKDFTVYITHPSLKNGRSWEDNIITWGHKEE